MGVVIEISIVKGDRHVEARKLFLSRDQFFQLIAADYGEMPFEVLRLLVELPGCRAEHSMVETRYVRVAHPVVIDDENACSGAKHLQRPYHAEPLQRVGEQ